MSKWLSGFFIVFPRNTLSSAGISVQRFLYIKNKPVSRSLQIVLLKSYKEKKKKP